ncbi:PilT protein domain protein [Halalkaliarchaeum desulfuricum]|uniref:PilT protein domain protein n=1 Tax=Halalkaliarchaeum desulfuricum TaxID=2055893 RepID=A0A343TK67_9EURY|nr:PIN domain-containing protein [Halalkaliarchaeum desulfuricum]AUX09489.1 PilT protein domain protein [Halalkaliarchaeum desulfuricum]
MILDSSYLFDVMDGNPNALEIGTQLTDNGEIQWLPTPVVAEVYYGVVYTNSEEERRIVQNALMGYPRVDITEEMARTASRLLAAADREHGGDSGVETNDAYIGAVAHELEEPVLTANPDDFEALGVDTETY